MSLPQTLLLAAALALPALSSAEGDGGKTERGWWFYETKPVPPEEEVKPEPPKTPVVQAETPEEKAVRCQESGRWTPDCGFVDPGNDFAFQSKQRDELLTQMVMNPNEPKAVEAFQYYTKWMMDQATNVANMWYFNRIQNPELDPEVTRPVSAFGLRLLSGVQEGSSEEIFKFLRENGMLVFFSRTDCSYCHDMAPIILKVAQQTGIEVWDASLDESCLPGFEKCLAAPATLDPARALQVGIVPSVFLHVEPSTWVRVSTGVTTVETLKSRIVNFFSAYRSAMLKGVDNGDGIRPSVDFSAGKPDPNGKGLGKGVEGTATATPEDITRMLKQGDPAQAESFAIPTKP